MDEELKKELFFNNIGLLWLRQKMPHEHCSVKEVILSLSDNPYLLWELYRTIKAEQPDRHNNTHKTTFLDLIQTHPDPVVATQNTNRMKAISIHF